MPPRRPTESEGNIPVHVGDTDEYPDAASLLLGIFDLIQVARIVVINRRPQPGRQITRLDGTKIGFCFGLQFLLRVRRKLN